MYFGEKKYVLLRIFEVSC